jgi:uncharacterized membrane protein (DUF4010 family)
VEISLLHLAAATLGGAAIGLERQWSGKATGPEARFGGIRTFTMLGAVAGVAGALLAGGAPGLATVLLAAGGTLVVIGYAARSRDDIDATTEVSALIVLGAGVLSGTGRPALGSGIVALTAILLVEKGRLHALVRRIDDVTLRSSARFAVLALVVLPLLPDGHYGPFGAVRPRELWILVLLFSGLSFAAWIARRLLGPRHGTVATGLLGGLISSTSVTLMFARTSREHPQDVGVALGTIAACTVMLVRVGVAAAFLNPPVALAFVPYAWPGLVIGLLAIGSALWRPDGAAGSSARMDGSPLQLRAALQMTALFQVVLILISAVIAWWSVRALLVTSAMVGLTDLDALTISLARTQAALEPTSAGRALAVGVLSNTLLKMSVAVVIGAGRYRAIVGGVLGLMAITTAGLLLR